MGHGSRGTCNHRNAFFPWKAVIFDQVKTYQLLKKGLTAWNSSWIQVSIFTVICYFHILFKGRLLCMLWWTFLRVLAPRSEFNLVSYVTSFGSNCHHQMYKGMANIAWVLDSYFSAMHQYINKLHAKFWCYAKIQNKIK